MSYLYETHCHCSQCSRCAVSSSRELVRAYHRAGYTGMVLTDHFIFGNTAIDRKLPWEQRMMGYYNAYLEAKEEAEGLDFDVIFGIEQHYGDGKEILIYGVGLEFLLSNPDIPEISVEEFAHRVRAAGGVVIHAHPYRERAYINANAVTRIDICDGIEVYNARNAPGEDKKALRLAQLGDYILTSGGDVHRDVNDAIGQAGILLPHRVRDEKEFAAALKQRNYGFLVEGREHPVIRPEDLP